MNMQIYKQETTPAEMQAAALATRQFILPLVLGIFCLYFATHMKIRFLAATARRDFQPPL